MSYSHQKRAGKARLEKICESSKKAAALHAKINRKKLDKPDISQICEEIINPSVPVALSLTGILMEEETNGAWRTKAIPDPTLLTQGRTYARKEAVTLLKKADFGNLDKKWQHKEKHRAGSGPSGEGRNTSAWSEHGSKQDIGSSSTTKYYVDSKGRFVDELGFTCVGSPHSDVKSTPPAGVTEIEIEAFVDMETMKFTSPEKVFLLRPQISTILDAKGDKTFTYKLAKINSFVLFPENDLEKSIYNAVSIESKFVKRYHPRRLVCGPCKQDSRNLPYGEKKPLLELEMVRKISVYAMTPGRKAVVIISNDLFFTSTFAAKLKEWYNELTVITPSVGCMLPVAMFRKKTASDVRPHNVQRGARNVQRGGH